MFWAKIRIRLPSVANASRMPMPPPSREMINPSQISNMVLTKGRNPSACKIPDSWRRCLPLIIMVLTTEKKMEKRTAPPMVPRKSGKLPMAETKKEAKGSLGDGLGSLGTIGKEGVDILGDLVDGDTLFGVDVVDSGAATSEGLAAIKGLVEVVRTDVHRGVGDSSFERPIDADDDELPGVSIGTGVDGRNQWNGISQLESESFTISQADADDRRPAIAGERLLYRSPRRRTGRSSHGFDDLDVFGVHVEESLMIYRELGEEVLPFPGSRRQTSEILVVRCTPSMVSIFCW